MQALVIDGIYCGSSLQLFDGEPPGPLPKGRAPATARLAKVPIVHSA